MSWDSGGGEVAVGFLGEDGEHVDALARAHEVDAGLLAGLGGAAELHDGGHVDGLDDLLEGHRGGMIHAGVGGADGGVEALGGLLIGGVGLLHLAAVGGGGRSGWAGVRVWQASGVGGLNSRGGACAEVGAGAGVCSSRSGEGSASGRGVPSRVNLRRSVTTKGLFCSDMMTVSHFVP